MIEDFPSAGTACRWAQENRQWYVASSREELRQRFPMTFQGMEREGMESRCALPLLREDRSFGALFFMSTERAAYRSIPVALLERVANPHPDTIYLARFTAPEFTSLCPVTGQPDFAHLVIDYVPGQWLLESKSLKLYVASFRNHGAFHEDCTVMIGKRIAAEVKPKWLRIGGYWYPRGGMPIDVFWQTGKLPNGMWVPDQGVAPYRGRG